MIEQSIEQNTTTRKSIVFFWTRLTRTLVQHLRVARQNAQQRAQYRAEMRQLRSLSQAALRDLGLSQSELGSVASELSGMASQERLRTPK